MERLGEIIRRQKFIVENGCHMRDALIVVLEGVFTCTISGESYTAGAGDICVFPAGVPFCRKVLTPIRCVFVQFEKFPVSLSAGLLQLPDPARMQSTIDYLTQAVEQKDESRTEHYLQDLFLLNQPTQHAPDIRDPVVRRSIRYMEESLAAAVTLDSLAAREALSKQSLIRKFRICTGLTPMQYLLSARLNESKILLRDTSLNISQIAQQCGFENVYYFSNCFRKATGISPSQYRKNLSL